MFNVFILSGSPHILKNLLNVKLKIKYNIN